MSKALGIVLLFGALGVFVYFNPDLVERLLAPSESSGELPATTDAQDYQDDGDFESIAAERPTQPGYGSDSNDQPYAGPPQGMPATEQCEQAIATVRHRGELVQRVEQEMQNGTFESQRFWYDCLTEYDRRSVPQN